MVQETIERAISGLKEELKEWWDKMRHHYPRHPWLRKKKEVVGILCVIINKQKYKPVMNQVYQLPGAGQPNAIPLPGVLLDAGTLQPIPGASYVRQSLVSDNPQVSTPDANGNALLLAPGTANYTAIDIWSYEDEDTKEQVSGQQETAVIGITITATPEQVTEQLQPGAAVAGAAPTTGTFTPQPAANATAQAVKS